MRSQILATALFLSTISFSQSAIAANTDHIRQLLATKQCQNCDLTGAGLVLADLSGANLSGANLAGANLSRANLTGADLRGANLSGASLFGVNLNSAKLNGASLIGADLRSTYLINAQVSGVDFSSANLQGAVGIPLQAARPEEFYAWGVAAAEKGSQQQAIEYFNQAIASKPDYAGAYLARAVSRYQLFDKQGAFQDAEVAGKFFTNQKNPDGLLTAQALMKEIQSPQTAKIDPGKPSFMDFVTGLGSVLLQFFPF